MPSLESFLFRLFWVASQLLCLCALDGLGVRRERFRWFSVYLMASTMLAVLYWPETPGWFDICWPGILIVTILRAVAMMEALHWQTYRFQHWSRLMGAAILLAFAGAAVVWTVSSDLSLRDWAIQVRRPLQVWTALLAFVPGWVFWRLGWRWNRQEDQHALILGCLCLTHAAVSLLVLYAQAHPLPEWVDQGRLWSAVDFWAILVDSGIYLWWAAKVPGIREGRVPGLVQVSPAAVA